MITLAGGWQYQTKAKNFTSSMSFNEGVFLVPGSTIENSIGTEYTYQTGLTESNVKHLEKKYNFIGKLWLKKELTIDDYTPTNCYHLLIERAMWQTELWVNGCYIGKCDSLSTEHKFDITKSVSQRNELVFCIDNTDIHEINTTPSAYTEETQSIWNGLIGHCEIEVIPEINPKFQLHVDQSQKSVSLSCEYNRLTLDSEVNFFVRLKDGKKEIHYEAKALSNVGEVKIEYQFGDTQPWSEFSPKLYSVEYGLCIDGRNICSYRNEIGFRQWDTTGSQLKLNGGKVFLRGTIDCCIFPLTGYPPMDEAEWTRIFTKIIDYGLNHVRFHTWCPPEAAFAVADRLGLYLQVEAPIWLDDWMPFMLGDRPDHYSFFLEESLRIIRSYGHHPSFCIFSCGNEIRGNYDILREIIQALKVENPDILYTLTTNWDRNQDILDDLFIAQTVDKLPVRGQYNLDRMTETTTLEFSQAISQRSVPVISHEVGQYSVYPAVSEIKDYSGNLLPKNFWAIRDDLEEKKMISSSAQFTYCSGRLAFELYKDDIEAALRTDSMGGYQLLGLNDFTGQSTATVGVLDSFWKGKGITGCNEFKMFANSLVPLVLMERRIYSVDEMLTAKIKIANFRQKFGPVILAWELSDGRKVILQDEIYMNNLSIGLNAIAEPISIHFKQLITSNQQLTLTVKIKEQSTVIAENNWKIWVFNPKKAEKSEEVVVANRLSDDMLNEIIEGQNVLLMPNYEDIKDAEKTTFFPVFWSPVHFKSKSNCGLVIDKNHPIFAKFPTEEYSTYQWKPLVETGFSIPFSGLENNFKPIIQAIPNFFNNKKQFVLAEMMLGKGKILISSLALSDQNLVGKSFKSALIGYMMSDQFKPTYSLSKEQIIAWFNKTDKTEQRNDVAKLGKCTADSELSSFFSAENGIMDNLSNCWKPIDNLPGHWWEVELPKIMHISEIRLQLLSEGTYYYNISSSVDGQKYKMLINKTADTKKSRTVVDELDIELKFLRITYGDVSSGADIGHTLVSLY